MKRKLLSIITALALCLSLLPGTAWAEEELEIAADGTETVQPSAEGPEIAGSGMEIVQPLAEEPEDKSGVWVYPYVSLVPKETATYTAGSGTITWEPQLSGDTVVSGTLTLNNATINAKTTGIQIPVPAVIVLEGTNSITVTNGSSDSVDHAGIVVDHYDYSGEPEHEDLTLRGPGSLTITSNQFGIIADGGLTIDGATVSVNTQANQYCITARHGDITVRDSVVYAKEAGALTNFSGGLCSSTGSIFITDSKVTTISANGVAMNAYLGDIRFANSDVVVIGNVGPAYGAPISFYELSDGIHFQINGGTLFAQNNAQNGSDIDYTPSHVTATDSAVIYYHGPTHYLIPNGNNIQYKDCSYNENTGEITVGSGYVLGNVEWNDNILFPSAAGNKALYGRNWINGAWQAGNITIPSGVTAVVPSDTDFFNYGTLTNNGTLVVRDYIQNTGTIVNNGTCNILGSGSVYSAGAMVNNGTLNIENNYTNFPTGTLSGNGTINGVVLEYNASVSPKQFFYVAHGDAELNANNLLVGYDSTANKKQTMTVTAGATLTIQENCMLNASESALTLSWDTLSEFLSVQGDIVVDGTLKLPPNATQEQLDSLHLSGTGSVVSGSDTYSPVNITGGTADRTVAKAGDTVTLAPDPVPGKQFYGWEAPSGVTVSADENGAYSFVMPSQFVTINAQYAYTVTFDSQRGSAVGSQLVVEGQTAAEPTEPERENCTFLGWYTDAAGTTPFAFTTPVTGNMTLYAKWNVPAEGVSLSQGALSLAVGEAANLTAAVSPADASNPSVTWSSSDPAVAEVDASGKVTARGAGTATITAATADGGFTAECSVTVTEETAPSAPSDPGTSVIPGAPVISGASSRPSGGGSAGVYAVTMEKPEHGEVTSSHSAAGGNRTVTLTATPDSGYVLDGLTVTDSRGNEIELTSLGGGKYAFMMPGGAVTVKAVFAPLPENIDQPCDGGAGCPSRSFTDLGTLGTWYHEAMDYVLRNGLMNGYSSGTFGPNDYLSRAMLAQILYNKAGAPAVTGGSVFSDAAPGQWYTPAVTWAAENGIVSGYGNGLFGPHDNITREQLAVMLWRYAGSPAAADTELRFTDADQAGGYALEALRWAAENGILSGYDDGRLDPRGLATRAQAAQMLKNYMDR